MPKVEELAFDIEKHEYRYAGEIVPSVTQLLKEFDLINFDGVPEERLEYKRVLGVAVHTAIQLLNQDNLDESSLSAPLIPYVEAYKRFREITGFETRLNEMRLHSKKWKFAGTPDEQGIHVSKIGDEEAVIDYKCTWTMYPATGPQLSGYKILIEENKEQLSLPPDFKIKKRYGLLLKPTGHYDLYPFTDPNDQNDFLACVHLHWRKRNHYRTTKGVAHDE